MLIKHEFDEAGGGLTVVGVAVFSLTLKSKVMTEKTQMSTPDPANEVKIPETVDNSRIIVLSVRSMHF